MCLIWLGYFARGGFSRSESKTSDEEYGRAWVYIRPVRRFLLALVIVGAVAGVVLLLSMAQNDGCLPWKQRVGASSPFSETRSTSMCR